MYPLQFFPLGTTPSSTACIQPLKGSQELRQKLPSSSGKACNSPYRPANATGSSPPL